MAFVVGVVSFLAYVAMVLYGLLFLLGRFFRREQYKLLYYPTEHNAREVHPTPGDFRIPSSMWEPIEVPTPDGPVLRGYHLFPEPPTGGHPRAAFTGAGRSLADDHEGAASAAPSGGGGATAVPIGGGFVSAAPAAQCTLLYFHGNAGNVSHRLPLAWAFMHGLRDFKLHVVMIDYRGYGQSDDAEVNEQGLKQDAQAALDWTLRHIRSERLFVMGTSLGAAVSIDLVAKPANAAVVNGLIVENTFTSISDMADALFAPMIRRKFADRRGPALVALLNYLVKPAFMAIGWFSIDAVRRVKVPTLFVSSQRDEIVPPPQMRALFRAWGTRNGTPLRGEAGEDGAGLPFKRIVELPNGTHNDAFTQPGYGEALHGFVREVTRREGLAAAPGIILGTA